MNPNQQGYYQPGQNQPVGAAPPPQPSQVSQQPQPVQPMASSTGPVPSVDPTALQAALNEPSSGPMSPQPEFQADPSAPVTQDEDDTELFDDEEESVTWSAHEYIHQEKGAMWFVLFSIVVIVLVGLSIWTQAWSFTVLIVVIAIVVLVYLRRPPRELTYSLTDEGLVIDGKLNYFENFKSFGIIRDGEEFSVMLIPTQRFQPAVTVYFPEEAGEDIVDMLGERLPMKDLKLDMVDRLVRLLRL